MSKPSDNKSRLSTSDSGLGTRDSGLSRDSGLLRLLRRPFVRDVGVLQIGSVVSLGVNFALSVALARGLGRETYGAYALVVSTMTTISLFKRLGQDYVVTTRLASAYARRDPVEATDALTT